MADIQIVMEVLGNEGVVKLTNNTVKLENTVKSLSKSLDAGRISEQQFNKAIEELGRTNRKTFGSLRETRKALSEYVTELKSSEAAQKAAQQAQEQLNQQRKKAELVLALQAQKERELSAEQKRLQAETNKLAAEEERLKMKFVEGHAAMSLYSKELNDLAVARKLNIVSAEQQKQKLAQLNNEMATGTGRFSAYNLQAQQATKSNNRLGVLTQQAGYQVGDFFVQVQSGTNIMVAFGQQATQMVGTFAMLAKTTRGIAIFSALGVAIPIITAIGAALMRTSSSAKDATKVFDELEGAMSDYASTTSRLKDSDFDAKFGRFADHAKRALEALKEIKRIEINESISNLLGGPVSRYERRDTRTGQMVDYIGASTTKAASKILGVGRTTEKDLSLIKEYVTLLQSLQNAKGFEDQVEAADKLNTFITNNVDLTKLEAAEREKVVRLLEITAGLAEQAGKANEDANAHIVAYTKERVRLLEEVKKVEEDAAKKAVDYSNKAREDQIEILKLEGKTVEAKQLAIQLARDKATQDVYSKFTQQELLYLTEEQKDALAQAAAESARNAEEAARTSWNLDSAKDKAKGLADNLREAASALASVANVTNALNTTIDSLTTEVNLLKKGESAGVSSFVGRETAKMNEAIKKLRGEGKSDLLIASYTTAQTKRIETAAALLRKKESQIESTKGSSKTTDPIKSGTEYIERVLKPELDLRRKSIMMSEEQKKRAEFEFDLIQKLDKYKEKASEKEIQAVMALYDQTVRLEKVARVVDYAEGQFENFFMTVIDGSQSIEDAFKGMLRNILLEIYRQQIAKPAATGIGNFLMGLIGGGSSLAPTSSIRPQIRPFANGGVVTAPTLFPMANGAGLMGEAGPEAIMPLKRGPNGKLGVEASGSSQQVVVNQSFNFTANGDESVKKIIAQAAPQIAQMTQKQIMDSRRRGGQMKATFS